jgi:hypothetical protein
MAAATAPMADVPSLTRSTGALHTHPLTLVRPTIFHAPDVKAGTVQSRERAKRAVLYVLEKVEDFRVQAHRVDAMTVPRAADAASSSR